MLSAALTLMALAALSGGAAPSADPSAGASYTGLIVACVLVAGAAFALSRPLVSMLAFLLAGFVALLFGGPEGGLPLLTAASLVLASLSFLGRSETRGKDRGEDGG